MVESKKDAEAHHEEYEFFGPHAGPLGVMVGLPIVCYMLVYACNSEGCLTLSPLNVPGFPAGTTFFSWEACAVVAMWMAMQIGLHMLLPGRMEEGVVLSNGKRLTYKLNGMQNLVLSYIAAAVLGFGTGTLDLGWAYDNFVPLLTASCILSVGLAVACFAASYAKGALLATDTPYAVYDFFMGRELNPRIGPLDIKEFCELYPGLIGWTILNLACAHKQYTATGAVSPSMVLVNAFHLLYVADAMWFERAILTTMDITTDGFGFMLSFGDLTWVPFIYSLQARVLVDNDPGIPLWGAAAIFALNALGYWIFRGANSQKDAFRRDPNHPSVAHLKTLETKRRPLLIEGWWGVARHINYFGDWVMGLAWCLPCGFGSIVPYFYAIYFGTLLVHRDMRDYEACQKKYGKDWDKYCSIVKYSIVPYVY